jgi:hypothetical protein
VRPQPPANQAARSRSLTLRTPRSRGLSLPWATYVRGWVGGIEELTVYGRGAVLAAPTHFHALTSHLAALSRARPTHGCTLRAMVILKLLTFRRAGVTDLCTELTQLLGVRTGPRHVAPRQSTDVGAVTQQTNTMLSGRYIRLSQARAKALLTGLHAPDALINALLVSLYVRFHHGCWHLHTPFHPDPNRG